MAATRQDVDRWIETAKKQNSQFIISVCDTYDWDDCPIYCKDKTELMEEYNEHNGKNMQRVNEIIKIEGKKVTENLSLSQATK